MFTRFNVDSMPINPIHVFNKMKRGLLLFYNIDREGTRHIGL